MKGLDSIWGGDSSRQPSEGSGYLSKAPASPVTAALRLVAVGIELQMMLESLLLHTSNSSMRNW